MAKSKVKRGPPPEECLILPRHSSLDAKSLLPIEIVDTHTHILSTFAAYASKYPQPESKHATVKSFVNGVLMSQGVTGCVDVWCEAPMTPGWKEVVETLDELKEDGFRYRFVVGAHPHEAKSYDEKTALAIEAAHKHPLCVGWGEIGLFSLALTLQLSFHLFSLTSPLSPQDYHYDNSPREIQHLILRKQLKSAFASGLNKAITIHTREADEDIFKILTEELPKEQKIHVHCFTDSVELAKKLLEWFPNLFIGITGVITYSSNLNTSNVIRTLLSSPSLSPSLSSFSLPLTQPHPLRILLESDSPYMAPGNLPPPSRMGMKSGQKVPFAHSGMLAWTAEFVAGILNEGKGGVDGEGEGEKLWKAEDVLMISRENARFCYGV